MPTPKKNGDGWEVRGMKPADVAVAHLRAYSGSLSDGLKLTALGKAALGVETEACDHNFWSRIDPTAGWC